MIYYNRYIITETVDNHERHNLGFASICKAASLDSILKASTNATNKSCNKILDNV